MKNKKRKFQRFDWMIFIPYIFLCIIGAIIVYSASSYNLIESNSRRVWMSGAMQILFTAISIVMMLVIYITKPSFWRNSKLIDIAYIISVSLLVLVLIIGPRINGAKGWFNFGPLQLQPMEIFKVMVIIVVARLIARRDEYTFKEKFLFWSSIGFGLLLILAQPDTGGFIICTLIILAMLACSGQSPMITLTGIGSFVFLALIGLVVFPHIPFIPEYMRSRFLVAYNPFDYARGAGHQLINSYYALNNGSWFGLGLGNSIEKRGFLPEAHTDFIFSVLVEELGLIVGFIVIAALLLLICRIFYIGIKSRNTFNSLICIGVGTMLFVQMFVNLGGLVGLIPLTGVTLPFISQGGSSLVFFSVGISLVMNISAYEYDNRLAKRSKKQMKVI